MVSEQEMSIYHDLMVLDQIEKKNEKTREVINLSKSKMSVIEESQTYMLNLLGDLEADLASILSVTRRDLAPLYDD
jgi:hypothetical protein